MIPKLRFREFTGEWNLESFSEGIKLLRGSTPRPIVKYRTTESDGVNWIKIGDTIDGSNTISDVEEKITLEGARKSRAVFKGDIILANSMSFGKSYLLQLDGYIYDGWFVLRDYEESYDRAFLLQLLNSDYMQRQYLRLSAGGVVQNISSEIVYSTQLPKPTIKEQQKVASFLEALDQKINLLTKKKEALETYKKGLMQKLFSQELRFKRDDGTDYPEWDCISLKDVVSDFIVPMRDKPKEFDGDVDWCRIEDIENGFINGSLAGLRVSNSVISSMNLKVLPIGSVIVSCSAYLGVCARVTKPLITNQTFIGLVPNDSVTTDFIYHLMTTKERILNRLSSGTTISYLARSEFERLNIGIPCLEEQKKISSTLNITDDSITRIESQIRTNQKLKKGLLQQMFV